MPSFSKWMAGIKDVWYIYKEMEKMWCAWWLKFLNRGRWNPLLTQTEQIGSQRTSYD